MNWTHRRPFRHQFNYGGGMNKVIPMNRPLAFREQSHGRKMISDQPIDAIRLQLSDCEPCPVHTRRDHPYITTFSDHQSSVRRTRSSIHSISTIETDFVHQRVSTIHTYPSSTSIIQRQEIIDDVNDDQQQLNQINNSQDNQIISCRTCTMLMDIVDQQTQQIRQCTEQISQQADLMAKLARRIADFEQDQTSNYTSEHHQ